MRMGVICRSQPMNWEMTQRSWEEQKWPQALSGSQQSPNQWVCSRKNVRIYTRYCRSRAGILRKKASLWMKEVRSFIIIIFSWEL